MRPLVSGLPLNLLNFEVMSKRGILVDHSTVHRGLFAIQPNCWDVLTSARRAMTGKWHFDETYIRVRGQW